MLKQRIITALWLAAVFLVTLLALPPVYLAVLVAVVLLLGGWEWGAFAELSQRGRKVFALLALLLFLPLAWSWQGGELPADWWTFSRTIKPLLATVLAVWVLAIAAVFIYPAVPRAVLNSLTVLLAGLVILLAGVCAILSLRMQAGGVSWIFYCVAIVAAADIGAYFSGRRFGRRKLAYAVSPGKSWEGFFGGLLFAQLVAFACYQFWFQSQLASLANSGLLQFQLVALLLSSGSVIGDLFESLLKRRVGIKDSSQLLPGHGGVLDRIDGLLPALPLLALSHSLLYAS